MTRRNTYLKIFIAIFSGLFSNLLAQQVGDFGTISNGNWGSTNIWRQWNGSAWSVNPNSTPDSSSAVYIFHNVNFNESPVIASLYVQSGTLSFFNNGAFTVRVKGNTSIASGAAFDLSSLSANRTNTLILGGDLFVANNATFDMQNANSTSRVANVTFNATSGTQRVYSDGTPNTMRFRNITINNAASYSNSKVQFDVNYTRSGSLSLVAGTIAQSIGTLQLSTGITENVGVEVLGNATLILPASPTIDGYLKLDGNNAFIYTGSISQPSNVGTLNIRNQAVVEILNGTLHAWGRITVRNTADVNVSGGTIIINNRGAVNPLPRDQSTLWIIGDASFQMTGGTIQIPNFNANTTGLPSKARELDITSPNSDLTGGTLVLGNGILTQSQSSGFWLRSIAEIGSVVVNTGNIDNRVIILDETNAFTILDSLSIVSGTFAIDSGSLSIGGSISGDGNFTFSERSTLTLIGTGNVKNLGIRNNNNVLGKLFILKIGQYEIEIESPLTIENALKIGKGKLVLKNANLIVLDTLEFDDDGYISGNDTVKVFGRLITKNRHGLAGGSHTDFRTGVTLSLASGSTVEYNSPDSLDISALQYHNLEFKGNGVKKLPVSGRVRIAGALNVGNTNMSSKGSIVEFNGNQLQTLPTGITLDTLHLNNTHLDFQNAMSIEVGSNKLRVTGKITPGRGHLHTNGNLVLVSDSSGTASVGKPETPTSKIVGDVVFQRYLGNGSLQRLIGVPVKGGIIGDIYQNNYSMVYDYFEPAMGPRASGFRTLSSSDSIKPGAGYYAEGGRPYTTTQYVGEVFDGTCHFPGITFTVDPSNRSASGWALVMNPYPAVIDWDATTGWTRNNISTNIFYINPETGQQISYNNGVGVNGASRYIAPGQGFWVKAFASFPTLICSENVKTDANPRFFRTSPDVADIMRIRLTTAKSSDETVIRLHEEATNKVDPALDAERMPEFLQVKNPAAWVSTCVDGEQALTINSIPKEINGDTKIQIVSWFAEIGNASLSVDLSTFDTQGLDVFIEDTRNRTFHNVSRNPVITFDVRPSELQTELRRFVIHFRTPGTNENVDLYSDIQVYPNPSNGNFSLETLGITGNATIQVVSITGTIVHTSEVKEMQMEHTQVFELSHLPAGIYFLSVSNQAGVFTRKVTIQ